MAARTVLALDTATTVMSLALVRDGEVLAERHEGPGGPSNSARLPAALDELLAEAGLSLADVDGLCVGLGPGAFTGLRVSLATAKGVAYARKLPVAGASSLEAMAVAAARRAPDARAVVPLLDARKGQVYAGFFAPAPGGVAPLGEPHERVLHPAALAAHLATLPAPLLLLGEGYFAYRAELDGATEDRRAPWREGLPETPPAAEVARLAAPKLGSFDAAALFSLEPHYVRASEAEEKLRARQP